MGKSPDSGAPYVEALFDTVDLLEELGIGYALVGGVASMYYGRARFTEDLDFVAVSGRESVLAANPQAMRQWHFDPSCTWKLLHDSDVEVVLWKDEHSDRIVERAPRAELAGRSVRIAEPHDLIAMKLRAGRVQDDYDISEIVKGTAINDAVVQERVSPGQFSHYQAIRRRVE